MQHFDYVEDDLVDHQGEFGRDFLRNVFVGAVDIESCLDGFLDRDASEKKFVKRGVLVDGRACDDAEASVDHWGLVKNDKVEIFGDKRVDVNVGKRLVEERRSARSDIEIHWVFSRSD